MTYYRTFIYAAIMILCWLGMFFGMSKTPKFRKNASLIAFAVALIAGCIASWSTRAGRALSYYDRIMNAESMTVTKDGATREIPFRFTPDGSVLLKHLDEAPKKVKEADFRPDCDLEFFDAEGKSIAKIRFGGLTNASDYPEDALIRINGSAYCFLDTKFLYRNALYYFDPVFAEYVIGLIGGV